MTLRVFHYIRPSISIVRVLCNHTKVRICPHCSNSGCVFSYIIADLWHIHSLDTFGDPNFSDGFCLCDAVVPWLAAQSQKGHLLSLSFKWTAFTWNLRLVFEMLVISNSAILQLVHKKPGTKTADRTRHSAHRTRPTPCLYMYTDVQTSGYNGRIDFRFCMPCHRPVIIVVSFSFFVRRGIIRN